MSGVSAMRLRDATKLTVRARAQRRRIVDAAERCFVESGFHAASIADIAATADMSPGLIYRYFKNKNAIVRAIIERCLEEEAGKTIERLESPEDMLQAMLATFDRWRSKDNAERKSAVLLLETTAEATRNDEMAAVVHNASEVVRKHCENLLRRSTKVHGVVLNAAAARGRAMVLQCLFGGLAVQAIRQPDFHSGMFKEALKEVICVLMKS